MPVALSETAPLMTEAEAAEHLGVKRGTLSVWRCVRRHNLPYMKVGRLVRYSRADLDQWLDERRKSGGEVAVAAAG